MFPQSCVETKVLKVIWPVGLVRALNYYWISTILHQNITIDYEGKKLKPAIKMCIYYTVKCNFIFKSKYGSCMHVCVCLFSISEII